MADEKTSEKIVGLPFVTDTFDNSLIVLGEKGSGKTVLLASFGAVWDGPVRLVDPLGVFGRKKEDKPEILIPGSVIYEDFKAWERDDDPEFQKAVFSFKPTLDELLMICESCESETLLMIDEISLFADRAFQTYPPILDFVRKCRNFGVTVILAAQRPQSIDPQLSELAVSSLCSRQTGVNARERAAKIIGTKPEDIRDLEYGEWLYLYPGADPKERVVFVPPKYPYLYK